MGSSSPITNWIAASVRKSEKVSSSLVETREAPKKKQVSESSVHSATGRMDWSAKYRESLEMKIEMVMRRTCECCRSSAARAAASCATSGAGSDGSDGCTRLRMPSGSLNCLVQGSLMT